MKPEEPPAEQAPETNMKPSMVVQQQRQIQMGIYTSANQPSIPVGSFQHISSNHQSAAIKPTSSINKTTTSQEASHVSQQLFDQDGLVLPKKILPQPISGLGSMQQQPIMRDLNRELKFNQIRGKNVLEQKSELKKAMEKLEESKRRREAEQERLSRRTSLELRLEERAERLAKTTNTSAGAASSSSELSSGSELPNDGSSQEASCKPLVNLLRSAANR